MENKKFKALIIGCGRIGATNDVPKSDNSHKIISFAKGLLEHGGFDIYCYDAVYEQQQYAEYVWNIKPHSQNTKYDVIFIATPDNTHFLELKKIIGGKSKFLPSLVVCEKPLCSDYIEAHHIVTEYERLGIPILVDYTRRFIPYWQDLKHKYKSGLFGEIKDYYIAYNRGQLHTGTHAVDFINWFFDSKYNNDIHLNHVEHIPYRVWQVQLYFEKKYIEETRIDNHTLHAVVPSYYDNHTLHVVKNAYNYLIGEEELLCSGEDALKALELIESL